MGTLLQPSPSAAAIAVADLLRLGRAAFDAGYLPRALLYLKAASERAPSNPEIYLELARILEGMDLQDAALTAYRLVLGLLDDDAPSMLRSQAYTGLGQTTEAAREFRAATAAGEPASEASRLHQIDAMIQLCDWDNAVALIMAGLDSFPDSAKLLGRLRIPTEAAREFRAATAAGEPASEASQLLQIDALIRLCDWDAAVAAIMVGLDSFPDSAELLGRLRIPMINAGRTDELCEIFDSRCQGGPHLYYALQAQYYPEVHPFTGGKMPVVVFVTLGKSGTIYISSKLADLLSLPRVQISIHPAPQKILPSWVELFAEYGGVCSEHMWPEAKTLETLIQNGIKRFVVHLRDPRQAMLSWLHHADKLVRTKHSLTLHLQDTHPAGYFDWSFTAKVDYHIEHSLPWNARFIAGWSSLAGGYRDQIDVLLTSFEEFVADEKAYFDKLLAFYGISLGRLDTSVKGNSEHFRLGSTDEWTEVLTPHQRQVAAGVLVDNFDDGIFQRFGWERR